MTGMAHSCNGCSLCCSLVPVKEIGLPAFTECRHRRPVPAAQPGCAIYSQRPFSCRHWSCLWLKNADWDDALRPDRCGVVFDEIADIIKINGTEYPCIQAWVRPGMGEDFWRVQPVNAVVLGALNQDLAVLFRLAPQCAFAVWRDAGGDHCSPSIEPRTFEPDTSRLRRAGRMLAERTGSGG